VTLWITWEAFLDSEFLARLSDLGAPLSDGRCGADNQCSDTDGQMFHHEVIIGEQGKVTGTVAAERVIVRGRTSGIIRAMTVALQASARVEGDIHHMSLTIEQGAEFDGRCRRPGNPAELKLDLDA
jgi:hypothetical protein